MSSDLEQIFSRKFRATGIGQAPVQRHIAADAAECAALAASFGLPGIAALAGDFTLTIAKGGKGGIIDAVLALQAKVTQNCVVSLEPFDTKMAETAKLRFVPAAALSENAEIAELGPEDLEEPDEISYAGEIIDLGAVLAEQLALALDPYPRKPGAVMPATPEDSSGNPFAALAVRQHKPGDSAE